MSELHVVFGTGPLGKSTARALMSKGKTVRMVNRSGRAQDIPAEVEVVKGDAYRPAATRELTRGATAVYQCAQPEYHEWEEKFPPLQASMCGRRSGALRTSSGRDTTFSARCSSTRP